MPETGYQVNGGPAVVIAVVAVVVVMCCVKVKYKKTTKTPTGTVTTFEVAWDCDCLSIRLREANKPRVTINDREIKFDRMLINTKKQFNQNEASLILAN